MATRPPHSARGGNQKFRYKFPLEHYSTLFEVPHSIVVKWYRKKLSLDEPKVLLEELSKIKMRKPLNLKRINELAKMTSNDRKKAPPPKAEAAPLPPALEAAVAAVEAEAGAPLQGAITAFQRELGRLQDEVDLAYRNYKAEPDALLKQAYWKTWKDMLDAFGKLAKLAPDAEAAAGNMIQVSEAESIWARSTKEARVLLDSFARRISTLPLFRVLNPVDVEQLLGAELNKVMAILEECTLIDEDSGSQETAA